MSGELAQVLADLPPKAQEGLELYLQCVRDGFTGPLRLDFLKGEPQLWRREQTGRFGRDG